MRCGTCGRISPENAIFCEICGSRLGMSQFGASPHETLEPASKDMTAPLAMLVLGIVIIAVGGVIYAMAVSNFLHNATDTYPDDPFGTMDQVSEDMSLVFGAYAVMAVGGLICILGVVLIILRMA
jgi:uncharacterized membrane protein YidH (DUF202 family)